MPIVLPTGFILLASYDERVGQEHKSGPKGDYAKILRELSKDAPSIAAYKDCGQWVAREADVIKFLASAHRDQKATNGNELVRDQMELLLDGAQAAKLFALLQLIADSLESFNRFWCQTPDNDTTKD